MKAKGWQRNRERERESLVPFYLDALFTREEEEEYPLVL